MPKQRVEIRLTTEGENARRIEIEQVE